MEEIFHGTLLSSQANLPSKMKRSFKSVQSQISILPVVRGPSHSLSLSFLHCKFVKKLTRNITNRNTVQCVLKCCVQNSTLFIQNQDCNMTHWVALTMLHMSNTEFLFTLFFCTFKKWWGKYCTQILGFSFQPYHPRSGVLSYHAHS